MCGIVRCNQNTEGCAQMYIYDFEGVCIVCMHKCSVCACTSVQEECGREKAEWVGCSQMAKDFF